MAALSQALRAVPSSHGQLVIHDAVSKITQDQKAGLGNVCRYEFSTGTVHKRRKQASAWHLALGFQGKWLALIFEWWWHRERLIYIMSRDSAIASGCIVCKRNSTTPNSESMCESGCQENSEACFILWLLSPTLSLANFQLF